MRKLLVFLALSTFGALAVQNTAFAHTSQASANCSKVSWSAVNYEIQQVNVIEVKVDGATVYSDANFGTTDTGNYPWSQAVDHSWSVKVNAPGTQYDFNFSGSQRACQPPETTTTVTATTVPEVTTTTTVPDTTTTVPEVTTTTTVPDETTTTTQPPVVTTTSQPTSADTTAPPTVPPTTNCSTGVTNEMGGCEPVGTPTLPATGSRDNSLTLTVLAITLIGIGVVMLRFSNKST